ncbi:neprilysin-1-like [Rhipicephalus microplus]|uniref:neprilysin-1-like n=1 Tax=Rhipicephalus microplus TaxID=6941 RepID=UPI003F6B4381
MKSQDRLLNRYRLPQTDAGEAEMRHQTTIFLTSLIVLLVGVLSCIFLLKYLLTEQRPVENVITVDTLSHLHVPKAQVPRVTRTMKESSTLPINTSVTTTPEPRHLVPSSHIVEDECVGVLCRYMAITLRSQLDYGVDPCNDFYKYVCKKYRGTSIVLQIQETIRMETYLKLKFTEPPLHNQTAFQKAAAMYKSCVAFASSHQTETLQLVKWMKAMNLDFQNEAKLRSVDPVEMMVRGSLDFGVNVIIDIRLPDTRFDHGKRVVELSYSSEQESWLLRRRYIIKQTNLNDYAYLFLLSGLRLQDCYVYAGKILGYEEQLRQMEEVTVNVTQKQFIRIEDLGHHTTPYVTEKQWANYFSKYTEAIYTGSHPIWNFQRSTSIIKELFENEYVGKAGLRYLVIWSIYRQLVKFTDPLQFLGERKADEACFAHVKKVMNLAILSDYFKVAAPTERLNEVRQLVFRIKDAFFEAVHSSSWLTSSARTRLLDKLEEMEVLVGSPGDRLEPEFVERFYKPLHDVPVNRLFSSWIEGRRLNTHYRWKDQKTMFYDEERVRTFLMASNTAVITSGQVHRPFIYEYGPPALNYAGMGMTIGHILMRGFDDAHLGGQFWSAKDLKKEYAKRTLCLRRSHRSLGSNASCDTASPLDLLLLSPPV